MIYKAYLSQEGGCDYTIGCGKEVIEIEADNMDDAKKELERRIKENYYDEFEINEAILFEINEEFNMDIKEIYKNRENEIKEENRKKEQIKEKEEYERLKNKYNNE